MNEVIYEGTELLARAFCHEIDHLDGKCIRNLWRESFTEQPMTRMRSDMMKIVYMGTPDFAVPPLRALAEAGYRVEAVVTQPDKPKGRGKALMPTPVKEEALKHVFRSYQPLKVREESFIRQLRELDPDVIIVAAFGPDHSERDPGYARVRMPEYSCLSLPKYRGAAPIQYAVIEGKKSPA